ncbi:hypothetical protein EZS27_008495 [termite gut metagenome]|uniref:DUF6562 domain-containing protein n=1 Tax=termite gut metagenome TaxID=433724 RepID=A0A5J4SEP6_9ZZZZ
MNKNAVWLLAFVCAFLFSCSSDDFDAGNQKDGMVDFTISTSIPQGIKTYATSDPNSGNGGATNVKDHALRYILEVWTKEDSPRLAYRDYQIVKGDFANEGVTFSARLLALEYYFVFWADFVATSTTDANAASADLYYKTNNGETVDEIKANSRSYSGLTAIEIIPENYGVSNDARDAFYAMKVFNLRTHKNAIESVTLTRPFGKYRLVATDAPEDYLTEKPVKALITYTGASVTLPGGFDALHGEVTDRVINVTSLQHNDVTQEDVTIINALSFCV